MFGCCSITLKNKQPETVNGSPEAILDRGVKRAARITGSWAEEIAEAVEGLDSEKAIRRALRRIEKALDVQELEGALAEADLHAGMLGALDSHYEAETEDVVAPVRFHRTEFLWLLADELPKHFGGSFASRGIDQAVGAFNRLEVLRVQSLRDAYEQLDQAAIRHAFWVSGETRKAMLQTVRKELARQVSKGSDLRDFRKFVKGRLESAGWTPKNKSHVETVFRTNVLRAYNAGRATQMQHPTVLALRPYWRIVGVKDNRTRANHRAVQGWELYASDEAWRQAYPPFGFNCFHPDTPIRGAIVGASRAWYSGKMLELRTAIGGRLSVTPNHPILTPQGLVPAHALRKGDKLLGDGSQARVSLLWPGAQRDEHQRPPLAKDVFRALSEATGAALAGYAPDDFHGEAARFDGQVEVVGSYRNLLIDGEPERSEQIPEFSLEPSPPQSTGAGKLQLRLERPWATSLPLPGSLELPSPLLGSHPGPLDPLRFGWVSHLDSSEFQLSDEGPSGAAELARKLLERFPGLVVLDELLDVFEYDWSGHVYDFASTTGWLLTDVSFASNCRERITSKRTATNLHDGSELLALVPDPGFRSGLKGLVVPPGPKPPKNHPRPKPPAPARQRAKPLPKVKLPPPPEVVAKKWAKELAANYSDPTKVRGALREWVSRTGMTSTDADRGAWGRNEFRVDDVHLNRIGARAVHGWNGEVRVRSDIHKGAKAALKSIARGSMKRSLELPGAADRAAFLRYRRAQENIGSLRTLIHEEVHGHSNIRPDAYQGIGIPIEEAGTELLAREIVKEAAGVEELRYLSMSYHEDVVRFMRAFQQVQGGSAAEAKSLATRTVKRSRASLEAWDSPGDHIDALVKAAKTEGLDEGQGGKLKDLLSSDDFWSSEVTTEEQLKAQ